MDVSQLICRCRQGDSAAIQALIGAYKAPVYRLALSILRDSADSEEATQDAFVAALSRLDSYRGESSFKTWLFAIALNVCRGRLRKRQVRAKLQQALFGLFRLAAEPDARPDQVAIRNETDRALWRAIESLGDKHREVLVLRYYHELTLDEIARVAGVSERTVRTRLHQAHEQVRGSLQEEMD